MASGILAPTQRFSGGSDRDGVGATVMNEERIASPEMFPKLELLPHLKCSRPGRDRRDRDEAGQHGDAG